MRGPAALAVLGFGLAACVETVRPVQPRAERYGGLRDLVFHPRPAAKGGPFFLDRFETRNADYAAFLRAAGREPGAALRTRWGNGLPADAVADLPIVGLTLAEAREFARWRLCRLPRQDEWLHAVTAGGQYRFPWGDRPEVPWCNTGDLGLGRATPVGAFESGRESAGAYDLLGNVAEWTETLASHVLADAAAALAMPSGWAALHGLLPWQPVTWLACADPVAPRLVVGGHFATRRIVGLNLDPDPAAFPLAWERCPEEWGDSTGMRLAADPDGLLQALLAEPAAPTAHEREAVLEFLRAPAGRAALVAALPRARSRAGRLGPVAPLLEGELGR